MPTIAVVDDNLRLLETVRGILEGVGHQVFTYDKPKAALDALRADPVDLVISDIYMPGMNGFELFEALRAILPKVPIIAISGGGRFSGESVLGSAEEFGATVTLAKPVRRAELLALVDRMVPKAT